MKRSRPASQPPSTTTTIVPADVKSSSRAKARLTRAGVELHPRLADALAAPSKPADAVFRIETCYDPVVARQYEAADNVSRRFAKTSVAKIRESVSWPTTAISIHEVIPKGVPVKVWFDLDGFDTDTHYVEFADRFSRQLIKFMATRYDHEIDQESDLQWMHSTKYADEPEHEPRCIRPVVKNSLHLTVPGIYVDSNEVHMRQLASALRV